MDILIKQSQFYLSQYLGALIHLPRVWRNLHADLQLTSLTLTVLQLARQLRTNSLIRIGATPLLKLTVRQPEFKTESEAEFTDSSIPTELFNTQKPVTTLRTGIPDAFQAITRTLFQTGSRQPSSVSVNSMGGAASERGPVNFGSRNNLPSSLQDASTPSPIITPSTGQGARVSIPASKRARLPSYAPIGDETSSEESLRENIVETWLQRQEETGRKPLLSFVEAHKLYRDLFEEYVTTAILPPSLFAERFLETPSNLTLDQAKIDLRVRLDAAPTHSNEESNLRLPTNATASIPPPFLPSYIPTALLAKGSLAFGAVAQSTISPAKYFMQSAPRSSETLTPTTISQGKPGKLEPIGRASAEQVETPERSRLPPEESYQGPVDRGYGAEVYGSGQREIALGATEIVTRTVTRWQVPLAYSPAAALYSTLAAHSTTAFISPTRRNGQLVPTVPSLTKVIPPFSIDRNLQTVAYPDGSRGQAPATEKISERIERILPITESHATPIYLRPPMGLPAVESTVPQRTIESTLPSPNIASTREAISSEDMENRAELSKAVHAEDNSDMEDDSGEAAVREQVKRMGKIIAEEARRHIGST